MSVETLLRGDHSATVEITVASQQHIQETQKSPRKYSKLAALACETEKHGLFVL
jgi:hypothetical protein